MLVTPSGIFIEVKAVHSPNIPLLISVNPLPMVTVFKLVQPLNSAPVTFVTLFGITIVSKLVHSSNAILPMLVTPSGMFMDFSFVQYRNALFPIVSRLFPSIVTVVRLLP